MANDEYEPSAGEQAAFSKACDLIAQLTNTTDICVCDIGRGLFIAAVSCLRKEMSNEAIAEMMYEYADDYATRG